MVGKTQNITSDVSSDSDDEEKVRLIEGQEATSYSGLNDNDNDNSHPKASWDALSTNVICHMIRFLNPKTYSNFGRTSKFYHQFTSGRMLVERFYFSHKTLLDRNDELQRLNQSMLDTLGQELIPTMKLSSPILEPFMDMVLDLLNILLLPRKNDMGQFWHFDEENKTKSTLKEFRKFDDKNTFFGFNVDSFLHNFSESTCNKNWRDATNSAHYYGETDVTKFCQTIEKIKHGIESEIEYYEELLNCREFKMRNFLLECETILYNFEKFKDAEGLQNTQQLFREKTESLLLLRTNRDIKNRYSNHPNHTIREISRAFAADTHIIRQKRYATCAVFILLLAIFLLILALS